MHLRTYLCANMVFILDKLWVPQKSNSKTPPGFRSERPFLPYTPSDITVIAHMSIEISQKNDGVKADPQEPHSVTPKS